MQRGLTLPTTSQSIWVMSGGASSFERIKQFSQPADRDAANGNLTPVLNNVGYVRSPGQLSCEQTTIRSDPIRPHCRHEPLRSLVRTEGAPRNEQRQHIK